MKRLLQAKTIIVIIAGIAALVLMVVYATRPKAAPAARSGMMNRPDLHALSGTVAETMNSGGYTYVSLEKDGKRTWAAVPQMKIKKGQKITLRPGFEMKNFRSDTLKRTFESIYFSSGLANANEAGRMAVPGGNTEGSAVPAAGKKIHVAKAKGSNAYTIGELYAKKALKDKTVVVRGKVVKAAHSLIMGKYWFHLEDGTGSPQEKTNDLVVTSNVPAKTGDIVIAKGTIHRDKDFGFGYKYAVILEEASIRK